ncbi:hypothetical protein LPJ73_003001, partial [Coemansia sp. RSA 2703]
MTRLSQFMADCMSVGALRGFQHFSLNIRSREEIVLRVHRSSTPSQPSSDVKPTPITSTTIHDHVDRLQATDESKVLMTSTHKGDIALPRDLSDHALEHDLEGINFLIAGYPRYKCPYVWLRTDHQSLIALPENHPLEKDVPLRLESIDCWRQFDIRPWDVLVEVICTALSPQPENPFAIDYSYFENVTVEERVVSTGAMLEFLRRVYLRHYFFSDIVLADIKALQKRHFHDINVLREFQMNSVLRDSAPPKPDELVRKWRSSVRTQERELDRQLRNITTEEAKVKRTIQQLAKKGDISSCRSLAKELVRSQKQKDRIITSKAQLNSILMELTRQVALIKVAGSLQKSTQVMKTVNQLMRIPQLQHTMMEMSKEMIRAGVIEEITEEMFEDLEDDELEEEAEAEVENVLAQITDGVLGKAKSVATPSRPVGVSQKQQPLQQQL